MSAPTELDRYSAVLKEAEQIRGVSLARDAWRRLRRNRVAVVSLIFLIVLSLLAFLTPILPLQSPYRTNTSMAFQPPTLSPPLLNTLRIGDKNSDTSAGSDWVDKEFLK